MCYGTISVSRTVTGSVSILHTEPNVERLCKRTKYEKRTLYLFFFFIILSTIYRTARRSDNTMDTIPDRPVICGNE